VKHPDFPLLIRRLVFPQCGCKEMASGIGAKRFQTASYCSGTGSIVQYHNTIATVPQYHSYLSWDSLAPSPSAPSRAPPCPPGAPSVPFPSRFHPAGPRGRHPPGWPFPHQPLCAPRRRHPPAPPGRDRIPRSGQGSPLVLDCNLGNSTVVNRVDLV